VQLVVVGVGLQVTDDLLPVGCEDVFVRAVQALVDLERWVSLALIPSTGRMHTFAHAPVYSSATGA
jgi:hypothetical protein